VVLLSKLVSRTNDGYAAYKYVVQIVLLRVLEYGVRCNRTEYSEYGVRSTTVESTVTSTGTSTSTSTSSEVLQVLGVHALPTVQGSTRNGKSTICSEKKRHYLFCQWCCQRKFMTDCSCPSNDSRRCRHSNNIAILQS
jgi:hypothetical protein